MRSLLVILLMLSLSYQWVVKLGVIAWYEVNKDYVAHNLCVNRNKPWKKCNGKCYLHKQLKKTDQQGEKNAPVKWEKIDFTFCIIPKKVTIPVIPSFNKQRYRLFNQRFLSFDPPNSIFHPPPVC